MAPKTLTSPDPSEVWSIYERALSLLPDGVLIVDSDGSIVFSNKAFRQIWRIPEHHIESAQEAHLLQYAAERLNDPQGFIAEIVRLNHSLERTEDEVTFKNGRVLKRRSVPIETSGDRYGRIWTFTDVTEARQAYIDHLTGLPNRRAYSRAFATLSSRAQDGLYTAFSLMDIDNFKPFNDQYGHNAGDDVLRKIGKLLQDQLGADDDEAFRIGGEEFAITCRRKSADHAMAMLEKLRQAIEAMTITHEANLPYKVVTASFGVSIYKGSRDPSHMFECTDQALYTAKQAGRNRIVSVESLANSQTSCPPISV